jgi:ribonuclease T1
MIRSFLERLLLALALMVFVLGSAGCARPATPSPTVVAAATVAPATAAMTTVTVTSATLAPQVRPTPSRLPTASRSPVAGATAAPISGGLTIATPPPGDRMATVQQDRLPPEAQDTIRLIARNGPFPYRQDGVVFENRERLLPAKATGYYHEYTVKTPGSPDRGARRLIRGGQNELYYTDDHYDSFRRVIP